MSDTPESDPTFETQLAELEALVEALESGELDLAESMDRFRKGVELSQACRSLLDAAQQQVETLMQDDEVSDPEDGSSETSD